LALAVGKIGKKWVKVAEFMGGGVTRDMCFDRWRRHVDPSVAAKKRRKGPWNDEKVCMYILQTVHTDVLATRHECRYQPVLISVFSLSLSLSFSLPLSLSLSLPLSVCLFIYTCCSFDLMEQKQRLMAAMDIYGRDWNRVAEYVGGVTPMQCCMHWDTVLDPEVAALKPKVKGPWTAEEVPFQS
jgi:hypothetical protein